MPLAARSAYGIAEANRATTSMLLPSGPLADSPTAQLIDMVAERDAGFEVDMFAHQRAGVRCITPADVRPYSVDADQLEAIKTRCTQWAENLRDLH